MGCSYSPLSTTTPETFIGIANELTYYKLPCFLFLVFFLFYDIIILGLDRCPRTLREQTSLLFFICIVQTYDNGILHLATARRHMVAGWLKKLGDCCIRVLARCSDGCHYFHSRFFIFFFFVFLLSLLWFFFAGEKSCFTCCLWDVLSTRRKSQHLGATERARRMPGGSVRRGNLCLMELLGNEVRGTRKSDETP